MVNEGHTELEDKPRSRGPSPLVIDENIKNVKKILHENCVSEREITGELRSTHYFNHWRLVMPGNFAFWVPAQASDDTEIPTYNTQ